MKRRVEWEWEKGFQVTWSEIPYEKSVSPSLNGVKKCGSWGSGPFLQAEKVKPDV